MRKVLPAASRAAVYAITLASALWPGWASAQPVADLAAIDRAVASFTGAEPGAPGGAALPVDRRLRLAACAAPLALDWYGLRREAVSVACPGTGGWKLYVPLQGTAAADRGAAAAVQRGDAVTIAVQDSGFAVSQPGEALDSGPVGSWVKVRAVGQNAPVIRARVMRPGLVVVDLGTELP